MIQHIVYKKISKVSKKFKIYTYIYQQKSDFIKKNQKILECVKNFIFKSLRVESMSYCFKRSPPKFQPQIRKIIAFLLNNLK
jgi:hypothetical protein